MIINAFIDGKNTELLLQSIKLNQFFFDKYNFIDQLTSTQLTDLPQKLDEAKDLEVIGRVVWIGKDI